MIAGIFKPVAQFFGWDQSHLQPFSQTEKNSADLLYRHRLKRSIELPPFGRPATGRNFWGKVFLTTLALAVVVLPFNYAVAAGSGIGLSLYSGTPQTITVSGYGFSNGETVNIYFNNSSTSPVANTTAAADSQFSVPVTIPANAPQGQLPIVAVGQTSGTTASNGFYVQPFTPSITAASSPNTPGSTVAVSGSGYAPNEDVNLILNGISGGTAHADSSGSFTNANFLVPNVAPGTYQLHGAGASSGADAVYYFYVGGFYPSAYPATYYLLPGQTLGFSGSGFAPGETVQIYYNGNVVSSFPVPSNGSFSGAGGYVIPNELAGGVRTFTLKSSVTNAQFQLMVTVGTYNGQVSPSSYYLVPGQELNFSGNNFAPNETVEVAVQDNPAPLASFNADSNGNFTNQGHIIIPASFAGTTKHFTVTGLSSHSSGAFDLAIQGYNPQISPSTYYLLPGQQFTISGSGFGINENVNVSLNGGSTMSTTTDSSGNFGAAGPFTAPFSGGVHMTAVGQTSGANASVNITLGQLYPSVSPSAWYVLPGSSLHFTGTGFAPTETVNITNNLGNVGSVAADSSGNFTTSNFTVPFGQSALTYNFNGTSSGANASVSLSVAGLSPVISADNYYVTPGTTIHVTTTGFAPGEGVTITAGSATVHITADSSGNASGTPVTIPFGSSGTVTVNATGDSSHASVHTTITIAPFSAQVTPSTWYTAPGSQASFTGSGFAANETVNITLNGSGVGSAVTNGSGNFSTGNITIPVTATSAHFVFTGSTSGATASVDIGLSGFSPQLTPSTWYAAPGSQITFSGTGFAAGETLSMTFNGSTASFTVAGDGTVSTTPVNLPYHVSSATFTFSSSVTHITPSFNITIASLSPSIWLSAYYDQGGKPLTVYGAGFGGGETVHVTFDSAVLGDITTDAGGNFTLVTTVPYAAAGSKTITATGNSSGVSSTASFTEPQVYVNVQLGAYAGAPGDAVTFIGSGFLPNDPIQITTDRTGSTVVYSFTADASGNFNDSGYHIPMSFTGGPLNITVTGTHSFTSNTITYYVTGP